MARRSPKLPTSIDRHAARGGRVVCVPDGRMPWTDPEVFGDGLERRSGIGVQVRAADEKQSVPRERRPPPFDLLDVPTPRHIGMMLVGEGHRARVGAQPLRLPSQPFVLGRERVFERQLFEAEIDLVPVVRPRTLDRVAQDRDQPNIGKRGRDAIRHRRVEEVVRGRLPHHDRRADPPLETANAARARERAAIGIQAVRRVEIEVVDLFVGDGAKELRVLGQIVVQSGRSAPLGPDQQRVGQRAGSRRTVGDRAPHAAQRITHTRGRGATHPISQPVCSRHGDQASRWCAPVSASRARRGARRERRCRSGPH